VALGALGSDAPTSRATSGDQAPPAQTIAFGGEGPRRRRDAEAARLAARRSIAVTGVDVWIATPAFAAACA
jgi:hypothetical protein